MILQTCWHSPYPMSTSRKGSSETCGIPTSVPLFSATPHDRPSSTTPDLYKSRGKSQDKQIIITIITPQKGESLQDVVPSAEVWKTGRPQRESVTMSFLDLQWRHPLPSIFTMGMESCRHHTGGLCPQQTFMRQSQTLVCLPVNILDCLYNVDILSSDSLSQHNEILTFLCQTQTRLYRKLRFLSIIRQLVIILISVL